MDLAEAITTAVAEGRFLVSVHARQRLAQRKIALWQIEAGLEESTILEIRPDSEPNPSIVVEESLADGTLVTVVWAWLPTSDQAKLVTVFFRA
jgi:hypothetical protein